MHNSFPLLVKARVWAMGIASPRVSFLETRAVASAIDRDFLADAIPLYEKQTGKTVPVEPPATGEFGDFIMKLLEWLASEEGKAFLKFIFSLFGFII